MKRNIITTLLLIMATMAMAQPKEGTFSIIPRVGVNFSTLSKENLCYGGYDNYLFELKNKWKTGMTAGVDLDYQVLPRVAVSLGVFYTEMGCKYENANQELYNTPGNYMGLSNGQTNIKYVSLPLTMNMYVAKDFALKLGVQVSLRGGKTGKTEITSTKFKVNDDGTTDYDKPTQEKFDYNTKSVDVSIPIGLSYEFMNVIVDARYNLGLTRVVPNIGSESPKNQSVSITAAYRLKL